MRALIAAIFSALLGTSAVHAAVVTIDFEDQALGSIIPSNLQIGRFRLSPNCHYDLLPPSTGPEWNHPSQWIGFDGQGCGDPATTNQNYLGTTALGPSLWIDYSGTPFTLLGLDPVDGRAEWGLTSSNGGNFINSGTSNRIDFTGSEWTNIAWLLFTDLAQAGAPQGFDNITFRVPEPATALLVVGGLAFLSATRRKRGSL